MSRVRTVHTQCFYASPRLLCPLGGFQSQTPRNRKWKYRPGEICKSHRSQREDERSHVLYLAIQREYDVHMRNLTYWQ